jgi:hypothetical protein
VNNILELKGKRFIQEPRRRSFGGPAMNSRKTVSAKNVQKLIDDLKKINRFWHETPHAFKGVLLSVYYNKIVAKSNRIAGLLKGKESNHSIVGAKFNSEKNRHIITYFVDVDDVNQSIDLLTKTLKIINLYYANGINKALFENKTISERIQYDDFSISKSKFKQIVADVSYIEKFDIEMLENPNNQSIITLYNVGMDSKQLLNSIGIDIISSRILDNQTVFMDENQLEVLFSSAPYLVSMSTVNLSTLSPDDFIHEYQEGMVTIPSPTNEPTIGVIDTLFDSRVYFSDWVDFHDVVDSNIPRSDNDYRHGTAVSSIIVDGPRLNPWLNDGCGRFKVRHFGVATASRFSSFSIIKQIRRIVSENRDIKVWNISLGSDKEINDNFISAEASVLDQIQFENDVIFVVAGTNKSNENIRKIGSPADSINSLVVNAVTKSGMSTKYSRTGLALSFFAKPDVSYYGGSEEEYIRVCEPLGSAAVAGTSYAAPWIARKLSYLIDVLGLNREIAKALIIDSARGWNEKPSPEEVALYGHGVVPIRIEDVVQTKDDEIKFLVSDVSEKWNTYNYSFPVPLKNDAYPFVSRATMCYFPKCDRTQGVDYTNTELNLHFGRIDNNGKIKEMNEDVQNCDEVDTTNVYHILEGDARAKFRKWDNVKYITEIPKSRSRAKKSYSNKNWGMEIKTNNRLDPKDGEGIRFGVVVTLKEINGENRIDEFIKNCTLNGWLVNKVDIKARIDIYEKVNEEIEFQ